MVWLQYRREGYGVTQYGAYVERVPCLGWGLGAVGQWTQPPSTEYSIPDFKKESKRPKTQYPCLLALSIYFEQAQLKSYTKLKTPKNGKHGQSYKSLAASIWGSLGGDLGQDPIAFFFLQ